MKKTLLRPTRREFLGFFGMAAGAAALSCFGSGSDSPGGTGSTSPAGSTGPRGSTAAAGNPDATVAEMIGQMLMLGFRGYTLDSAAPIHAEIASGRVGNVVYFSYDVPSDGDLPRNIQSPEQVAALSRQVQSLGTVPHLIAVDQEGGLIARLSPRYGFPQTLSAQELGELNDPAQTRRHASAMAATLKAAGINLNLAPVVDVNVDPQNPIIGAIERSFSADPEVVAQQALAYIEGHHDQGVLCTLKHFPGHGSSEDDSHLGFTDVTATWSEDELIPFQRVIAAGKADAVMTAHIFNSRWDETYPATLSRATITGILRERLGFDGVVITDDMMMGAISNYYAFPEAVEAAVLAGSDIIAVANNPLGDYVPDIGTQAFDAILAAVRAGRITEQRIEQSYQRIMRLKARLA